MSDVESIAPQPLSYDKDDGNWTSTSNSNCSSTSTTDSIGDESQPTRSPSTTTRSDPELLRQTIMASKTEEYHDHEVSGRIQTLQYEAEAVPFGDVDQVSLQVESHGLAVASCTYDLAAVNLSYKINIRRRGKVIGEKVLLNNITAAARHGEVMAIMGPSGASKSTFLDALAGRICRKSMSGTVLVNGEPMTNKFKRVSGYVMQDDVHFPMLTARETLMYSARLRLPSSIPVQEKKRRVDAILELLGLKMCADTRIGNEEIGGVSGGERRRISIALDLIHDPTVLFLDEPTSGLDCTSALQVMQCLQKLARERSRTIVLAIHQPSYRILDTIDNSLVLAKGNVIYQGHHNDMIKFFSSLGFVKPEHVTVVEYLMDKIEEHKGDLQKLRPATCASAPQSQGRIQRQRRLSSYDYKLDLDEPPATEPEQLTMPEDQPGDLGPPQSHVAFANSTWNETWLLSDRNFRNAIRTRPLFVSRIIIVLITGLIMATLFFKSSRDEDGIREREVFFAFTIAILVFTSTEAMPVFLLERQIFIRETSRGAYRASSYVLSYSIVVLPFTLVLAILSTVSSYFAVGLVEKPEAILFFTLVLCLVLSISNAFVAFISGLVPNFISGLIIFGATSAYQFLFCGFFIPRHTIPKFWLWLHYASFFKYAYEGLLVNEFGNIPGHTWFRWMTSERILEINDCKRDSLHQWLNILYLTCFFVGYRFLFYLTLRFHTNNIRK